MAKSTFYKKKDRGRLRQILHFFSIVLIGFGIALGLYILFPIISWEIYLRPVFANQTFAAPIPDTIVLNNASIRELLKNADGPVHGVDYMDVASWLPSSYQEISSTTANVSSYYLAIPTLHISHALVATTDTKLGQHLVHFPGTALPGERGTTVIFGHSTLPQLFNQDDYKTIFATTYLLKPGDEIDATIDHKKYKYSIMGVAIVDADDTSYLQQKNDANYLALVTCTPPGTTWKRLIIKARLERI